MAAQLCRDQQAETLIGVLHDACTRYGCPKKLLTGQGSGFYSWSREQTKFQEYLDDQKIEHIVAEPHAPTSQGKEERLIQTLRTELLKPMKFTGCDDARAQILAFVQSDNYDRPHQALHGMRPAVISTPRLARARRGMAGRRLLDRCGAPPSSGVVPAGGRGRPGVFAAARIEVTLRA